MDARPSSSLGKKTAIRVLAAGFLLTLSVLLIVASRLEPSESGLGTHHQLGLPPCSVRLLWGIRCPSCGMTTSWAHLTKGNLFAATKANVGGVLLAFCLLSSVVPVTRMIRSGQMPSPLLIRNATVVLIGVVLVTLADWAIRLAVS